MSRRRSATIRFAIISLMAGCSPTPLPTESPPAVDGNQSARTVQADRGETKTNNAGSGRKDGPANSPVATNVARTPPDDVSPVGLRTTHRRAERHAATAGLDPRSTGWQSEVVAEQAAARLQQLASLLGHQPPASVDRVTGWLSDEFRCSRLRPTQLDVAYEESAITVRVAAGSAEETEFPYRGAPGLIAALAELAIPLGDSSQIQTHVKVVDLQLDGNTGAHTTCLLESSAVTPSGRVQQRATWECVWQRDGDDSLQLASLAARGYEEVTSQGSWLVDCTQSALGHNASFQQQLAYGLNHWLLRIESVHVMSVVSRFGIATGDANNDGLEDIYVCQPAGLPNRLYVQQPDGTATDDSARANVDWLDHTSSALFVDLDNDGDQDLVTATAVGLIVMSNNSRGEFQQVGRLPPVRADVQSLSAIDFDSDGDLDLYICVDFASLGAVNRQETEFRYHDANDGGTNLLLRNDIERGRSADGDWQFTDVTSDVGLAVDNQRHSLAAAWEDFDNDGDPDLYVANDYGQNCLYRNDGGNFVNVADEAGVVDFGSGMSVSWGDYNRDGWFDLYVGNMFSSAGSRITRQTRFQADQPEEIRSLYRRFAKGNTLFVNQGDGTFRDVGAEAHVEMGRWAWNSVFADINNDGWEDLLVANGYITTEDTGDL